MVSQLDPGQIVKHAFDDSTDAIKVNVVATTSTTESVALNDGTITSQKASVSAGGALKVDNSGVTQPVSAASLPLPTGASTSANQSTEIASLSSIDTKTPALGQALAASSVPVVLTSAQLITLTPLTTVAATQSGTWNVTNVSGTVSLPTGAATSAKQPALGTAGTASADVISVQGIASMTALKVDGSAVTQPVSGTVTSNIGTTNGLALDATLTGGTQKTKLVDTGGTNVATISAAGALKVDGSAVTQPISAASLPLPSGAATAAKQPALGTAGTATNDVLTVQGIASMTALKVDGSAVTQPVSGTVTANAGTNLNTSALALDTSVNGLIVSQGSTTSGEKGPLIQGAVTTAAPSYTTAQTSPLSLTTAGALRTDASATTQPISGTVTVQQSTASSLKVDLSGTSANTTAIKVDGSAVTQPISGTVTVNALTNSSIVKAQLQDNSGTGINSSTVNSHVSLYQTQLGYGNAQFVRNDYTSVNVLTSAYVQLIASTTNETQEIWISDTSGQTLKLATGAAASEVDKIIIPQGGFGGPMKFNIPSGTRVSIKALSATASAGEINIQLLG